MEEEKIFKENCFQSLTVVLSYPCAQKPQNTRVLRARPGSLVPVTGGLRSDSCQVLTASPGFPWVAAEQFWGRFSMPFGSELLRCHFFLFWACYLCSLLLQGLSVLLLSWQEEEWPAGVTGNWLLPSCCQNAGLLLRCPCCKPLRAQAFWSWCEHCMCQHLPAWLLVFVALIITRVWFL